MAAHAQDPRRQHVRRQRRAGRHRGLAPSRRAVLVRHPVPLDVGPDRRRSEAQRAVDRRSPVLRGALLPRPGTGTVYIDAKLTVIRQRAVGDGFHEELTILNHDDEPVDLEGPRRGRQRLRRPVRDQGRPQESWALRRLRSRTASSSSATPARPSTARHDLVIGAGSVDEHGLTFTVRIEPHGSWTTDLDVVTSTAGVGGACPAQVRAGPQARPSRTWSEPSTLARRRAAPGVRLGPLRGDLPAQPRRPGRAAVLAAGRRRQEPQPPAFPGS